MGYGHSFLSSCTPWGEGEGHREVFCVPMSLTPFCFSASQLPWDNWICSTRWFCHAPCHPQDHSRGAANPWLKPKIMSKKWLPSSSIVDLRHSVTVTWAWLPQAGPEQKWPQSLQLWQARGLVCCHHHQLPIAWRSAVIKSSQQGTSPHWGKLFYWLPANKFGFETSAGFLHLSFAVETLNSVWKCKRLIHTKNPWC